MFEDNFCDAPDGGSRALEGGAVDSAGGSPRIAENEGILEFKGVSDGAPPLFFAETAVLSDRGLESVGIITGDWVGIAFPGSSVFAGAATGSLGGDAGLAALEDGVARSGIVVESAGLGAGVGVGNTSVVDMSIAAGVNALGGSKRAKVAS